MTLSNEQFLHESAVYDIKLQFQEIQNIRKTLPEMTQKTKAKQRFYYEETRRDVEFKIRDKVLIQSEIESKVSTNYDSNLKGIFQQTKHLNCLNIR